MNSLNRMQPYKPRAFCFDELRVLHKYDIKLYGLARRDEFPRTELLAGGKKIAATSCASKFSEADPGGVSWSLPSPSPFARRCAIVLMKRDAVLALQLLP